MAEEIEDRDLTDAVFWNVDLTRARFRDTRFVDVTITHSHLERVEIDGFVDQVVINGVDVTEHVQRGDQWHPLRTMLRPTDSRGFVVAWDALEAAWAPAIERARALTDAQRRQSVNGEWSFVQTLRHLVFAIDKWFTSPVLGEASFAPMGIPNSGSVDFPWPGIDPGVDPTFDEVLAARAERAAAFRRFIGAVTPAELDREVDVLENGPGHKIRVCLWVVLEEEFQHLRYALRDLSVVEGG